MSKYWERGKKHVNIGEGKRDINYSGKYYSVQQERMREAPKARGIITELNRNSEGKEKDK